MSLTTPAKLQELQKALYLKAKREQTYRFYALYDKVSRTDVLTQAYARSKANGGQPGVDGKTFEDIEAYGRERFLTELQEELRMKRYHPEAVRRVMIPKIGGGERPLGIPAIKDRVVQTAVKLIIEPIFEADFTEDAYGYRPGRSANQAVRRVHGTLKAGHVQVVDADLTKFFDRIPHEALMRSIARRVSDGAMLHLIKMWLTVPVEEINTTGKRTRNRSGNCGTPQGGVVSPLLANIYMRRFLKAWAQYGYGQKFKAQIVNYADDLVILCRGNAAIALQEARNIFARLGLTLNEEKTRICQAWEESFDFLGYTFGVQYRFGSGQRYMAARPSQKSMESLKIKLRAMTGSHMTWQGEEKLVSDVNRVLEGWVNYFNYGTLWKTYSRLERFVQVRIRGWLVRKHKVGTRGECRYPAEHIYKEMGLLNLAKVLSPLRTH